MDILKGVVGMNVFVSYENFSTVETYVYRKKVVLKGPPLSM
jgi:hypothetical protein